MRPLAVDLFCGLGGWAEGLLAAGFRVVGFDIERHDYGTGGYPGELVLQDVRTLSGAQFRRASLIVASPPCQQYSYRAMPFKRAKALPPPDNALFEACFRIREEASRAAGRPIPLVVENVKGAQKWVGSARWHFGPYFLWGDVPALMPFMPSRKWTGAASERLWKHRQAHRLNDGPTHKTAKARSAMLAKIPYALARWIGDVYWAPTIGADHEFKPKEQR